MLCSAAVSNPWTYPAWEWVRTRFWPVTNSPVFVSLLSLALAWWIAHRLAARWQRANGIFQIRMETIRLLVRQYLGWSRTFDLAPLLRAQELEDRLEDLRESLLFAKVVFRGATAREKIDEFTRIAEERTAPTEQDHIPTGAEVSTRFYGMMEALVGELRLKP